MKTALPVLALGAAIGLAANLAGAQSLADQIFPRTAIFRTAIEVPARRGVPIERVVPLAENCAQIEAEPVS